MAAELSGRSILVVEDSPLVADFAEAILEVLGCKVVGPARNMAAARELAGLAQFDAALVDVRIRGEKSFPICEILSKRGAPFVLTSGYGDWAVPEVWKHRPRLPKPYNIEDVKIALLNALATAAEHPGEASG